MIKELLYPFDSKLISRNKKRLKRELLCSNQSFIEKRIAIFGGSTFDEIKDTLEIFLLNYGIKPIFFCSEYNKYWESIEFDNRELDVFKLDLLFFQKSIVKYWHQKLQNNGLLV